MKNVQLKTMIKVNQKGAYSEYDCDQFYANSRHYKYYRMLAKVTGHWPYQGTAEKHAITFVTIIISMSALSFQVNV